MLRASGTARRWLALLAAAASTSACGARTGLDAPEPPPDVPKTCGDGIVQAGEECDDANDVETDACLSTCRRARCGDGVRAAFEACDDGNDVDTDGCRNDCTFPTCGDGVVEGSEECDDPDPTVCSPLCRFPVCGDGFVDPADEACDLGPADEDRPAILLINGGASRPVIPVRRSENPTAFYDYQSESSHTGFEALHASELFLFQETAAPGLSLFTIHGIDLDSTGLDEGDGKVNQNFSGLPPGTFVALGDEPKEFALDGTDGAKGRWKYHHNTDGGVLSGIPFPGAWVIRIDSKFLESIDAWRYIDGDGAPISLEAPTAILEALPTPSKCRLDCTIPRCGDGILDGGEVCDDGNTVSGDGCAADCLSTD